MCTHWVTVYTLHMYIYIHYLQNSNSGSQHCQRQLSGVFSLIHWSALDMCICFALFLFLMHT